MKYKRFYDNDCEVVSDLRKSLLSALKADGNHFRAPHVIATCVYNFLMPYVKSVSFAETTYSVYLRLKNETVLRVSDHSQGAWIHMSDRANKNGFIELNTRWSMAKLADKIVSIKRILDDESS